MRFVISIAIFYFMVFTGFAQEFKDENLIQEIPTGYKIGFKDRQGKMIMFEFVKEKESVNNWSEMITTQVFLGANKIEPQEFREKLFSMWTGACEEPVLEKISEGKDAGYDYALWLQNCKLNKQTNKPENTLFKAIKGSDSAYIIQKAFKYTPSAKEREQWIVYLNACYVCDTRLSDRPCPKK